MAGEKLPRPAEAGDAFAEVILKACAFDREERYANAEEFREALERVKAGSSSAKIEHVRKTQELEHAPGKINPQKVQHQISAKNTTERPKTSNPAVPNESRDRRDSDCTQKQSGKTAISKKSQKESKKEI